MGITSTVFTTTKAKTVYEAHFLLIIIIFHSLLLLLTQTIDCKSAVSCLMSPILLTTYYMHFLVHIWQMLHIRVLCLSSYKAKFECRIEPPRLTKTGNKETWWAWGSLIKTWIGQSRKGADRLTEEQKIREKLTGDTCCRTMLLSVFLISLCFNNTHNITI